MECQNLALEIGKELKGLKIESVDRFESDKLNGFTVSFTVRLNRVIVWR